MSTQYYLLMRLCSSYCSDTIYIGIYDDIKKAEKGKLAYMEYIHSLGEEDKKKDKGKILKSLEEDIIIKEIKEYDFNDSFQICYLLCRAGCGMGQIYSSPKYCCDTFEKLEAKYNELKPTKSRWSSYKAYEEFTLNEIRFENNTDHF